MSADVALRIEDQTLVLLPDRAVLWLERRTVIVADTHFGKSGVFGAHGLAVPAGADDRDRERLTRLVRDTGAARLIVLGDFLHAPLQADGLDARALEAWSASLGPVRLLVIAGNHDRGARSQWRAPFEWREGELLEPPFLFTHDVERLNSREALPFVLSGHVHPVVRLRGLRKRSPRVPVFWRHSRGLILPSFGLFTGGQLVVPAAGDRLFAAAPERVVPFPNFRTSSSMRGLE